MSTTFQVRADEWQAMWRGRTCPASFNSKGAAQAWIDVCEAQGRFRY